MEESDIFKEQVSSKVDIQMPCYWLKTSRVEDGGRVEPHFISGFE